MPVFLEDLSCKDIPNVINVISYDEKHDNSELCDGAVGFYSNINGVNILNIYKRNFDLFNIHVVDDLEENLYYQNPFIPNSYIDIEKYFVYLKEERVRELVRIAYELGAKHCEVELRESGYETDNSKVKAGIKKLGISGNLEEKARSSFSLGIAASECWEGHEPTKPILLYYKNESHIHDLIERRMNKDLISKTYELEYCSKSSMLIKEAIKLDGVLKIMKIGGSQSLESLSELENNIKLFYTIEF